MPENIKRSMQGRCVRILALGEVVRHQRFEDAIEAVKLLVLWGYDPELSVMGSGAGHADYAEKLQSLVHRHGLDGRVVFSRAPEATGRAQAYRRHDVFIWLDEHHADTTVLFEAMAAGLAPIVSRAAKIHEHMSDCLNCVLVDRRDPENIARAIREFVENPNLYQGLSREAIRFARRESSERLRHETPVGSWSRSNHEVKKPGASPGTTMCITSFHQLISRNILATPVLDHVLANEDVRIILVVPEQKKLFFKREFDHPRITIAGVPERMTRFDRLFRYLSLAIMNTPSLGIKRRGELEGSGAWLAPILSRIPGSVPLVRCLDHWFRPRGFFAAILDGYRPKVVFATDVQNENDVRFMHEARSRGIALVGMVRSWDNLGAKGLIRVLPDLLVVQNAIVAREAVASHRVPREQIRIVGIPHYDNYLLGKRNSREDFFRMIAAPLSGKLVLYTPVGDRYVLGNTVDQEVISIILSNLPRDGSLLIRLPPTDVVSLDDTAHDPRVMFDRPHSRYFDTRNTELTREDDQHLANTLYHADLVVCGPSTMAVDAVVFNKPVILVGFDGFRQRPYLESVRRYFDYDHWPPVLVSGGVKLAETREEFEEAMQEYLADPAQDHAGRRRLALEQLSWLDGASSKRMADLLLAYLGLG